MAIAGVFADIVGMRTVFFAGGAIAVAASAVAWALFRYRPGPAAEPGQATGGAASLPTPPVEAAPG